MNSSAGSSMSDLLAHKVGAKMKIQGRKEKGRDKLPNIYLFQSTTDSQRWKMKALLEYYDNNQNASTNYKK